MYIVWWCAAELAPSATRQRRCGHRSNGLPRQSGVVAAASSSRPCGHRGRQAACGNGVKLRRGRSGAAGGPKKGHEISPTLEVKRGVWGRGRGARRVGGRGEGKTQHPTNDAGDADAGNGKEDDAVQAALHDSILTHQPQLSDTSGLSGVPKQEQIERLNAELLSFLRVVVHVPGHGDCLFDALVHVWKAEVGQNAPEAPLIV